MQSNQIIPIAPVRDNNNAISLKANLSNMQPGPLLQNYAIFLFFTLKSDDDIEAVKVVLDFIDDIDKPTNQYKLPKQMFSGTFHCGLLHFAVHHGAIKIVKELVRRGANVNAGETSALSFALLSTELDSTEEQSLTAKRKQIAELLIEHGANINKIDYCDLNLYHIAYPETKMYVLNRINYRRPLQSPSRFFSKLEANQKSQVRVIKLIYE